MFSPNSRTLSSSFVLLLPFLYLLIILLIFKTSSHPVGLLTQDRKKNLGLDRDYIKVYCLFCQYSAFPLLQKDNTGAFM